MKLVRTVVLGCLVLGLGCSKKEDDSAGGDDTAKPADDKPSAAKAADPDETAKAPPAKEEESKEPPPDDVYEGSARVINLVMVDGKPAAVDVWATRSFKYAPVKLAENIGFGEATDWFKSPKGSPVKIVPAGKDADDKENHLAGMFHPKKGENIVAVLYNDKRGKPSAGNFWVTSDDAKKSNTPDAPPKGKGYVELRAGQLRAHEDAMKDITGGWAFRVGDGKGKCMKQRVEALGFQASLLGGTQPVKLDLDPGKHTITFHKGREQGCKDESKVYELEVEVEPDTAQMVVLYTPDIKTLKHASFDMPVNEAKPFGTNKKLKEEKDAARAAKKKEKAAKEGK